MTKLTQTPPHRQRRTRPEVVAITIERLEHLTLTVSKTDRIPSLLINGIEERLGVLEDAPVPGATLHQHDIRLRQVEAALRPNGHDRGAA